MARGTPQTDAGFSFSPGAWFNEKRREGTGGGLVDDLTGALGAGLDTAFDAGLSRLQQEIGADASRETATGTQRVETNNQQGRQRQNAQGIDQDSMIVGGLILAAGVLVALVMALRG